MTTLVAPIKPFRAWQYRKDSGEAMPEWARKGIPASEYVQGMLDGNWIIELGGQRDTIWYTPAEFAERFKIVEEV